MVRWRSSWEDSRHIIPELERVIAALGDDIDSDYWKPTDGNAKRALMSVLAMAKMRPDALIRVH